MDLSRRDRALANVLMPLCWAENPENGGTCLLFKNHFKRGQRLHKGHSFAGLPIAWCGHEEFTVGRILGETTAFCARCPATWPVTATDDQIEEG